MKNKIFKIISPSLKMKYHCDAFMINQENDKTYSVTLLIKPNSIYIPKKKNSSKRISKVVLEQYLLLEDIKEIKYISKEI